MISYIIHKSISPEIPNDITLLVKNRVVFKIQ